MNIIHLIALACCLIAVAGCAGASYRAAAPPSPELKAALARAGANRPQLETALKSVPADRREGMEFLIVNMPDHDLKTLKADFLLDNVNHAYEVVEQVPWGKDIPKDVFLNNILPYASVNERRDNWRKDFRDRFLPLIKDCKTPGQAGARLNQKVFPLVKVRYSTRRPKADQSPYESIKAGMASCTGLSILLVDACRAVGVPARFVGTPLWTNRSGNHSWVEIWDDGWHYTGAAEPAGDRLDVAWFGNRAATAKRDDRLHAIYAVSYRRTPLRFPLSWNGRITYVRAVNVTDRYTAKKVDLPAGQGELAVRVLASEGGDRVAARITISDAASGKQVFSGNSKGERFDLNDHLLARLPLGKTYTVRAQAPDTTAEATVKLEKREQMATLHLTNAEKKRGAAGP